MYNHDHHAQIEEDRHHAGQYADDRQLVVAGADCGAEDVPLADEACRRRQPAKREQRDGHQCGQRWMRVPEPRVVAQVVVRLVARAKHRDNAERGEIRDRVHEEVEEDRRLPHLIRGNETDEQIPPCAMLEYASMRFKLLCATANDGAKHHRRHRDRRHDGRPSGPAGDSRRNGSKLERNTRANAANAAALTPVDMKPVTIAGAPS
jgi:hypothetical protein